MASKDELSHSEWHDSDSGRRRFLWRHGWKFLRARHSKRAEIVGTEPSRRDRRWRHYLLDQRNTKDRRRERFDRNSVANRNHNRQGINTWIGVARRVDRDGAIIQRSSSVSRSSWRQTANALCTCQRYAQALVLWDARSKSAARNTWARVRFGICGCGGHLARRALIEADPVNTTVTQIATNNGFWELGRFAVYYKELFGEAPSESLHRPSRDWWVTE